MYTLSYHSGKCFLMHGETEVGEVLNPPMRFTKEEQERFPWLNFVAKDGCKAYTEHGIYVRDPLQFLQDYPGKKLYVLLPSSEPWFDVSILKQKINDNG